MSKKLVRDKICSKLKEDGYKVKYRILDDDEFKHELIRKLHEETTEYEENFSLNELADIIEVVLTLIDNSEFSVEEINRAVEFKRARNGGFHRQMFLESYTKEGTDE